MPANFFESCQELVFPSSCLGCEQRLPCRNLPLFCGDCLAGINFINSPICTCCGTPLQAGADHLCGLCLQKHYFFDLARSAFYYQDPVASLISSLKFNGDLAGLATLAYLSQQSPGFRQLADPDIIIPVPLHIKRLRERKFNQAYLACQSCFQVSKNKIAPALLIRHRATSPQTGLSGTKRRKNLAGAFSLTNTEKIKGKNILLVDDVFTTGSTVNECAKVLKKAGARRIEVFTLARAI